MQRTYRRNFAPAAAGMLAGSGLPLMRTGKNTADSRYDLWNLSFSAAPAGNTVVSVTVDGRTASVNVGTAPTIASAAVALIGAIRQTDIYDKVRVTLDSVTNSITLENKFLGIPLVVTSVGVAASKLVNASLAGFIPFGRFVARPNPSSSDSTQLRLPASFSDPVYGVTLLNHLTEKSAIGPNAVGGYGPNEMMDVVEKTMTNDGIWVEYSGSMNIPEVNIVDTQCYAATSAGNQGKATNVPTNAAQMASGVAYFRSKPELDPNGKAIILVRLT